MTLVVTKMKGAEEEEEEVKEKLFKAYDYFSAKLNKEVVQVREDAHKQFFF